MKEKKKFVFNNKEVNINLANGMEFRVTEKGESKVDLDILHKTTTSDRVWGMVVNLLIIYLVVDIVCTIYRYIV